MSSSWGRSAGTVQQTPEHHSVDSDESVRRAARRVYHAALAAVAGPGSGSGSATASGFRGGEAAALALDAAEAELRRGGADARHRARCTC